MSRRSRPLDKSSKLAIIIGTVFVGGILLYEVGKTLYSPIYDRQEVTQKYVNIQGTEKPVFVR